MIPLEVDELTPEWLSDAMDADVDSVTVLDRHSGTTGRAHLALTGHSSLPATVFAKLAPFDAGQRKFVNLQGMGVAEARLYRDLAHTGIPPAGIHFCISPMRILPAVRATAVRIA